MLRQVSAAPLAAAVRCGRQWIGKTTLLRLLNRLIDPTSGKVSSDGVPLTDLDVLVSAGGLVRRLPWCCDTLAMRFASDARTAERSVTELLARLCPSQSARGVLAAPTIRLAHCADTRDRLHESRWAD